MIARTDDVFQPCAWQEELAQAITDPIELLAILGLTETPIDGLIDRASSFRMRVPRGFAARMRKNDPKDPLLRQVLPLIDEKDTAPGFTVDPVGDLDSEAVPGVLHKYEGRALLVSTSACGIHCRYCFRRHFPYAESNPSADRWRRALDYIAADPSIIEVILSGGDPLSMTDRRLAGLSVEIAKIPHVQRLRVHTRMPIVLPERVEQSLIDWLTSTHLRPVMVVHANHANEIDPAVTDALIRLSEAGITLLNQSVLLQGVNDDTDALTNLSEVLFRARVLPYYLHLLDPVQGAAHFDVTPETALVLIDELRTRLPGYLVPRLVWEKAGAPYKLSVEQPQASTPSR